MKIADKDNCKRRVIYKSPKHGYEIIVDNRSPEERAKEYDLELDQRFPAISNIPQCPECGSDKVASIFYGSTPSGGHDDKGNPVPPDKPFHPCREFAESLKARNRIIALDAHVDYIKLYRWAATLVQEDYDEFMKKGSYDEIMNNGGKYDRVVEAKIMASYTTIRPMWHCCDCEHNFGKEGE